MNEIGPVKTTLCIIVTINVLINFLRFKLIKVCFYLLLIILISQILELIKIKSFERCEGSVEVLEVSKSVQDFFGLLDGFFWAKVLKFVVVCLDHSYYYHDDTDKHILFEI